MFTPRWCVREGEREGEKEGEREGEEEVKEADTGLMCVCVLDRKSVV